MTNCKENNQLHFKGRKKSVVKHIHQPEIGTFFEFERQKHMETILLFILNGKWKKTFLTISIHSLAQCCYWQNYDWPTCSLGFLLLSIKVYTSRYKKGNHVWLAAYSGNRNKGKSCQSLITIRYYRAVQSNLWAVFSFSVWVYHCLKCRIALGKIIKLSTQANKWA